MYICHLYQQYDSTVHVGTAWKKNMVIHHSVLTIVYIGPDSLCLSLIVMATRKVRSMRLVGVLSVQVDIILMKFENVSNIEPSQALLIAAKVTHNKVGDNITQDSFEHSEEYLVIKQTPRTNIMAKTK